MLFYMKKKRQLCYRFLGGCLLIFYLLQQINLCVFAQVSPPGITSPSAVLMEASTGTILYEKDADEQRSPASITKIMTLLLIFDALHNEQIALEDEVVTSAYAMSMGGSKVFLEAGEIQSVETLIKCIVVSSGNDASVAMAEYIAGSEEGFVDLMNQRAESLGLENTHFEDCCGLTDSDNHYSSARDVAIMSRELTGLYPEILEYSGIWMEDIVHQTARGSSIFTLSSTNKLLRQYPYTTGLKTGYTSTAKHCLAATATKDGVDLIAVILAAPDSATRFAEAQMLLEYGFCCCNVYVDENMDDLFPVPVSQGIRDYVAVEYADTFRCITTEGIPLNNIEKQIIYESEIVAPVEIGTVVGKAVYSMNGVELGSVNIVADETVEKAGIMDNIGKIFVQFLL